MGENHPVPRSAHRQPPHPVLHLRPSSLVMVLIGGVLGAAAREAVEQALPTSHGGFPTATVVVNLSGAFLLGVVLEALVRLGDDAGHRRRIRLLAGTGFLGAFTTYSTFAVESDLLVRAGHDLTATAYVLATVLGGLVASGSGIFAGTALAGRRAVVLPVDPDVDPDADPDVDPGLTVGRGNR